MMIAGRLARSNPRTRAYRRALEGRSDVVIAVFAYGYNALVSLDDGLGALPDGIHRWSVHVDDLNYPSETDAGEPAWESYPAGVSGLRRETVIHAVLPGGATGLCTEPVRPLPISGWILPFDPTSGRACVRCGALASDGHAAVRPDRGVTAVLTRDSPAL
ncbi:hypothetical protein [[Actinomadura] parvosata]|uniref:hypothetical protein n=1 Tax=[Actinomadura] parvosata TaxID=1955412 RepID=UPI0012BB719D|nr:hypothetical protein [Nonomuraea sp. ATCC 55076]